MLSLTTPSHFLVFLFSAGYGSCIGYVDGNYVGFQHLYSEALLAFFNKC
jgi:hypothetical protein